MANVIIDDSKLYDIGRAIRNKNGSSDTYKPSEMPAAIEAIETYPEPTGSVSITENGTANVKDYATAIVNVSNTYEAEDEGKVVSEGALVAQGSLTVNQNGTYDTTLVSELIANVAGGGSGSPTILKGTDAPSNSDGNDGNLYLQYDDAHVTSSGSQYLNTGVIVGSDVEFEIDFTTYNSFSKTTGSYGCVFGGRTGSSTEELQITTFRADGTSYNGNFAYGSTRYNARLTKESRLFASYHDGVYSVNGTETSIDTTSWTGTYSLYLFALNNAGTAAQYGTIDLYSFKIWKDGTLVKNYTPAQVDGTACLYDAVSDSYEYPSGTLTYTAQGLITAAYVKVDGAWTELIGADKDDPTASTLVTKTITANGTYNAQTDDNADGYSEVTVNVSGGEDWTTLTNYIESSGTQYIDTGYIVSDNTIFEVVADVNSSNATWAALFGARAADSNSPSSLRCELFAKANGSSHARMNWGSNDTTITESMASYYGIKSLYTVKKGNAFIDNNSDVVGTIFSSTQSGTDQYSIYIFTTNKKGSDYGSTTHCTMKLYRFRIYEDTTLVHEFVPWKDDNDIVCLKDTVTDTLFYNAGTGDFTYGTDA